MSNNISSNARFLLYVDILGFAEMTWRKPRKVNRIYSILDSLNVHRHGAFKTIAFSDTVLVYNPVLAESDKDRNYLVWYLIEFAEDLHHRLTAQDIYFRAVITTGNFSHYQLKNIECFFGDALVNAYLREKAIPSIGLFIDNASNRYNEYFRTERFDENLYFVYLNRHLEYLDRYTSGQYPFLDPTLEDTAPYVPWQVRFLKDIYSHMRFHPSPKVRAKFLTAWDFHNRRYPAMLQTLIQNDFALTSLAGRKAWVRESAAMAEDIRYFSRMGGGAVRAMHATKAKSKPTKAKRPRQLG